MKVLPSISCLYTNTFHVFAIQYYVMLTGNKFYKNVYFQIAHFGLCWQCFISSCIKSITFVDREKGNGETMPLMQYSDMFGINKLNLLCVEQKTRKTFLKIRLLLDKYLSKCPKICKFWIRCHIHSCNTITELKNINYILL